MVLTSARAHEVTELGAPGAPVRVRTDTAPTERDMPRPTAERLVLTGGQDRQITQQHTANAKEFMVEEPMF